MYYTTLIPNAYFSNPSLSSDIRHGIDYIASSYKHQNLYYNTPQITERLYDSRPLTGPLQYWVPVNQLHSRIDPRIKLELVTISIRPELETKISSIKEIDRAIENFDNSYKYRNVFKAIIRRMFTCIQDNKKSLASLLSSAGFSNKEIKDAFERIKYYKNIERKTGSKKMAPQLINESANKLTVFTFILKEALRKMLYDWDSHKLGELSEKNIDTYRTVCRAYINKINSITNNIS